MKIHLLLLLGLIILVSVLKAEKDEEEEENLTAIERTKLTTIEDNSEQELSSQLQDVEIRASGWTAWSEWSSCSRSCDGGVAHQLRRCRSATLCRGERVRYKICNMQPCPESREFRIDQCAAFDNVPYDGILYRWYPHYDDLNLCSLTCNGRPVTTTVVESGEGTVVSNGETGNDGVTLVVRLSDKVQDGTRCRPGSLDMCIDGKCQRVGCDLKIGSNRQVDACGVCGGDGSSCSKPLYHWTLASVSFCSATCGGGYKMSRAICQNRVTGNEVEEQLCNTSQKPDSSLVKCNTHNCPPKWHASEWSTCSVSCGGGSRLRQVNCVEEANNTKIKVIESKCTGHKPKFQEACNQFECPKWHPSSWSGCSVSCGEGVQVRIVECRDSNDRPSNECQNEMKPSTSKQCSTGIQCPFILEENDELLPGLYHTQPLIQPYPPPPPAHAEKLVGEQNVPSESTFIPEEWGPCSVTCGEGVRRREVHCKIFLEFSRTIAKLPDKQCTGPKPMETERCFLEPCSSERIDIKDDPFNSGLKVAGTPGKTYTWKEQGYTHCSATCLGGVQELIVNCVRDDTQKVTSPYLCPRELKPEILIRTCNDHPCPPRWNYSDFQPCTLSCGIGIQTREVNCIHEVTSGGGNTVVVPNNMCPQPPPPDRQYCNVLDCPVRWRVSEWTKCSKTCGTGEKTRKVECKQVMAQNHTVDRPFNMCPSPKPPDRKPCNTKSCVLESDRPHIDVYNSTFIQHDPKKKTITLKVGGAATVFHGTTVKIKCPVKRFNRTKIQWIKGGNYLPKMKKYKVSKKGALRIHNLNYRDSGVYTCIAGKSTADLTLSIRQKPGEFLTSEEIQKQTALAASSSASASSSSSSSSASSSLNGGVKGDFEINIQPGREEMSPIFSSDDHSHEQRPDFPKKKPTSKTKLFTPTLPSLRIDVKQNGLNAWSPKSTSRPGRMQDQLPSRPPTTSTDSLKPPSSDFEETSSSSASRVMPHFQKLISNIQTFANSRGHRMVALHDEHEQFFRIETTTTEDDVEDDSIVVLGKGSPEHLKFEWIITDWSGCSQTCGGNGYQMRRATCVVKLHNNTQTVDNNLCQDAGLDTPDTFIKCGIDECPKWSVSDWTPCDTSKCFAWNTAMQRRELKCQISNNVTVGLSKCDQTERPPNRKECRNDKCVGKWKPGPWSECTASTCDGRGIKYRILQCVWYGTKKPAGTACKDIPRPNVMKPCKAPPCQKTRKSKKGVSDEIEECKDHSMFCPNVKTMNMCKMGMYQRQCCQSCNTTN